MRLQIILLLAACGTFDWFISEAWLCNRIAYSKNCSLSVASGREPDEARPLSKMAAATPSPSADIERTLLSFERLDRASPELWPEQMPGVSDFAPMKSPLGNTQDTESQPWEADLEQNDIDMLNELGSLTTANLMEKVKGLQNLAYQLGLEESREMTRGKFLNILVNGTKRK